VGSSLSCSFPDLSSTCSLPDPLSISSFPRSIPSSSFCFRNKRGNQRQGKWKGERDLTKTCKGKRQRKRVFLVDYHGRKRLERHGGDEVEVGVLDRGGEESIGVHYYVPSDT